MPLFYATTISLYNISNRPTNFSLPFSGKEELTYLRELQGIKTTSPIIVSYCCVKKLLQIQQLKTTQIHYFTVSKIYEVGHGLAGCSAQGLNG